MKSGCGVAERRRALHQVEVPVAVADRRSCCGGRKPARPRATAPGGRRPDFAATSTATPYSRNRRSLQASSVKSAQTQRMGCDTHQQRNRHSIGRRHPSTIHQTCLIGFCAFAVSMYASSHLITRVVARPRRSRRTTWTCTSSPPPPPAGPRPADQIPPKIDCGATDPRPNRRSGRVTRARIGCAPRK